MKARRHARRRWWQPVATGTALLASLLPAAGQGATSRRVATPVEPEWLRFRITQVSLGAYSEGQFESAEFRNSDTRVTNNRFFIGPLLGLNFEGSIYHPSFLSYRVASEGAFGWTWTTTQVEGQSKTTVEERDYLGAFAGSATFLGNKPYATTAYANYDHTFRQYDFFNEVTVDTWRYGVRSGYVADQWSLTGDFFHRSEEEYGFAQRTTMDEDVLNVDGTQNRARGSTALNYNWNQYTRTDFTQTGSGNNQGFSIGNTQFFGEGDKYRLFTSGSWADLEQSELPSTQWLANANLDARHSDTLVSRYAFSYDQFDTTDFVSRNYIGHAELEHQFYDSLTTTLIAEGNSSSSEGLLSESTQQNYTGGFSHAYVKRLSDTANLRLDNTLLGTYTIVDTDGAIIQVFDERHNFANSGTAPPDSFFLNRPRVLEQTIVVTDDRNTVPPFVQGVDYRVIRVGIQTMIQRVPGSRIGPNQPLLVDYDAVATPSGEYATLTEAFRIRVNLFRDLWGIYGRIALSLNDAPEELFVQDVRAYVVGSDVQWKWLRAGIEYEYYDATLSRYAALVFFQSFNWTLDDASTFGANFSQRLADYYDPDRTDNLYTIILRYSRALSGQVSGTIEGGVSLRRGWDVDQTLATCRPVLEWRRGKTAVRASYDFEHNVYLNNEIRNQHLFAVRYRRIL